MLLLSVFLKILARKLNPTCPIDGCLQALEVAFADCPREGASCAEGDCVRNRVVSQLGLENGLPCFSDSDCYGEGVLCDYGTGSGEPGKDDEGKS